MTWFKVDDGFMTSSQVLSIPKRHRLAAVGLWTAGGCWSSKELTDGFVPDYVLTEMGGTPYLLRLLVNCGLYVQATRDGRVGHAYPTWLAYNPSAQETRKRRVDSAARVAKHREQRKQAQNDECNSVTVTECNSPPTRPDPSRPDPTRLSTSSLAPAQNGERAKTVSTLNTNGAAQIVLDLIPRNLPRKDKTKLRTHIQAMLDDGTDDQLVRDTVQVWLERTDAGPDLLPHLVSSAVKRRTSATTINGFTVGAATRAAAGFIQIAEKYSQPTEQENENGFNELCASGGESDAQVQSIRSDVRQR